MSTGMFLDTNNLYHRVRKKFGDTQKIDYGVLLDKLAEQFGELGHKAAYGVQINGKSQAFIGWLAFRGFETHYYDLHLTEEHRGQTKIPRLHMPTILAIHALSKVTNDPSAFDTIILGTAEPTFKILAKQLTYMGFKVVIVGCDVPDDLREAATEVIEIDETLLEAGKDG